ncbi:MAG: polymer-forming cytoskeletal protein [Candidatus Korobacteraceae bacterium]
MLPCTRWLLLAALLSTFVAPGRLYASDGDQVHVGHSITVGENERAGNLVCVGCSIRMEGASQDVVAVGGSVMVDGTIKGDVVAVGGSVFLGENASVSGDVVTVAGHLSRHPNAVVSGEVTEQSGTFLLLGMFLIPLVPLVLIVALIIWLVRRNRRPTPVRAEYRP